MRLTAGLAVLALAASPVSGALASSRSKPKRTPKPPATFNGRTAQQIAVQLGPLRSYGRAFRYQARMSCSDGSTFTDDAFTDYVVVRNNRFSSHAVTDRGAVITTVTGILSGKHARGTIQIIEYYSEIADASGNTPLDPNGGIKCNSGIVRWSATAK